MKLAQKLTELFRNLRLKEMRWFWTILGGGCVILILGGVAIGMGLWLWILASFVLTMTASLAHHEYQRAIKGFEAKVSVGRLESIVTNLEDAVIAYDSNFKILIFNSAAEKLFNLPKEKVISQVIGPELASDKEFRLLVQTLFPSLAPSVVGRSEPNQFPQVVDISFDSPEREFRVSTDRVVDGSGRILGFVKVVKDKTREAELDETKSEFVSIAAHQLRTPLTGINWGLEELNKSDNLSEKDKEVVRNSLQAVITLLKTVNDLLSVAEIEGGQFGYEHKELELVGFVEGILANAQIVAQKYGLQVFFDKSGLQEIKIMADPNKLGLALSNLLDNAMKYNSKNGSVTVRLKNMSPKPYVQISVQDTGVGIPPGDAEKIFEKFYRAQNARRIKADGSGLGLYIAKNIINQHGGEIWMESTLGRGTIFYFTLPTDPSLVPKEEGPAGQ